MSDSTAQPEGAVNTRAAWQHLWDTGVTDSFGDEAPGSGGARRTAPLAAHWLNWFSSLPAGTRVLDLCSGNGALPRWLLQACDDATVSCDGVDLAAVQPLWVQQLPAAQGQRLRFHSGVSACALPFADDSFDQVVSQYGVEYAGWPEALPEALRVLKPGGRLGLVLHHTASRPAQLAHEEISHARWLLDEGWWPAAREMAQALSRLGSEAGRQELATSAHWAAVRERFDQAQRRLHARASESICPDLLHDALQWSTQGFQLAAQQGPAAGDAALDQVRSFIGDAELRLRDLLAHALDEAQFASLSAMLQAKGLRLEAAEPLQDSGHLMGWWLQGSR